MIRLCARLQSLLTLKNALLLTALVSITGWAIDKITHIGHVRLTWTEPSYNVADDFFGVAIDAAMVTDGHWWENSNSPPRPLDFGNPTLTKWTTLLAPDWIRLGGTEADKLWLWVDGDNPTSAPILEQTLFNDYLQFTENVGAKPFITINTGPLTRSLVHPVAHQDDENHWHTEQLERLLNWLPKPFQGVLEFGNEPGAHWLIFGRQHQIGFDQLAEEFSRAQTIVNAADIELAGPANAFWPDIGEPLKQVFGSSQDFLAAGAQPDIFTWHYYPTQSRRCSIRTEGANWESLLDVDTLQEFEKRSSIIQDWLSEYSPNSLQWLGETGPAQCGGKAKLTDRFGASLWWLAHLGVAVTHGNKTVIRQSLMGGDYALLGYRKDYTPNPDYWASVLWQQNMGTAGYRIAQADKTIRAIAHCHKTQANTLSIAIINLQGRAVTVDLPQAKEGEFIDMTSLNLSSRFVFVEGQLAETLNWNEPQSLPWQPLTQWRELPGHSYRWVNVRVNGRC